MPGNKTQPTGASVEEFLAALDDETQRQDSETLISLMRAVTGLEPEMWGPSIIGFGHQHMVYSSGRAVDWFWVGFSPRKQSLTLYIMDGFHKYGGLLSQLGRHSIGKSCLYLIRLNQVDLAVLEDLIRRSVDHVRTLAS